MYAIKKGLSPERSESIWYPLFKEGGEEMTGHVLKQERYLTVFCPIPHPPSSSSLAHLTQLHSLLTTSHTHKAPSVLFPTACQSHSTAQTLPLRDCSNISNCLTRLPIQSRHFCSNGSHRSSRPVIPGRFTPRVGGTAQAHDSTHSRSLAIK